MLFFSSEVTSNQDIDHQNGHQNSSFVTINTWLSGFAYRIDIGIGMILAAGTVSLLCALGTVSFQAFKAARLDPVKSLRYE